MAALDGVLGRSCAEHTSLPASLPSLPYVPLSGWSFGRESVYESIEKDELKECSPD